MYVVLLVIWVVCFDLFVFGVLLYDIGKGWGIDYSVFGVELVILVCIRLGLLLLDVWMFFKLVCYYLLLLIMVI